MYKDCMYIESHRIVQSTHTRLCLVVALLFLFILIVHFSKIVTGYNIGERSLVPNGALLFIDLYVDGINPYGNR